MTTISLTDVTVSSNAAAPSEGWLNVQFSNGQTINAYCPENQDAWDQGAHHLCAPGLSSRPHPVKVDTLLLQAGADGTYIVLQATLSKPVIPMTYARPADEHIYLELPHQQQSVFSVDFLAIAALIAAALYGLKRLFEKYVLKRF